ncbi:hypothetical protein [Pseudonocardia zijingensis]|jgi:hypothetical protein|uniref:Transcriptional regulator, AbiEi antitoxin, Type IV TA system n=1 Tax=Pseudonocardia zijingensis TaxID=153376 RepID=A0ABP4AZU6_9PSEU
MRRRAGSPDPDDLLAAALDGVIRARTLVELGVEETTVYRRCRDGGPWQRLAPGIVLMATGHPTPDQLATAALLHGGPEGLITGLHACHRHGIRRGPQLPATLHMLVPHVRQVRSTELMYVERTKRLPPPVVRGGFPLAPPARAVSDAVRRLRSRRDITELVSDAVQRGLCTVSELSTELTEGGRRGSSTPRSVLLDVSAGVLSAAEADAKRLWARSGLPEPWWNARVHDADGNLLGIADAWWDDVCLAWEINSFAWHLAPEDYAREQEKRARFAAAGVNVLPTLPRRLRANSREVLAELRKAYEAAAASPRPRVWATPRASERQQGGLTGPLRQ